VAVPLNAWWAGPELRYALEDSGTSSPRTAAMFLTRAGEQPIGDRGERGRRLAGWIGVDDRRAVVGERDMRPRVSAWRV
jgi:hypothetical protein